MKYRKIVCLLAFFVMSSGHLQAQQSKPTPYLPAHTEILQRYRKVQLLDSITRKTVFKHTVNANWLPGGETCWYVNYGKDSTKTYYFVNARTGHKEAVIDTQRITQLVKNTIPANPVNALEPSRWDSFSTDSTSPDKQWVATTMDGNVYIRKVADGTLTKFTSDGDAKKDYYGAFAWSPDSKYLVGYRIHPVVDSAVYYVLTDVPGTTRGQLRSQPYKQPGDPFTSYEMSLTFRLN